MVRGERVSDALNALNFLPQKVTRDVKLTILSAVHNMIDQHSDERIDESELIVSMIKVDEGSRLKRFRPVSRGRAHPILKRTAHLTVVVSRPGTEDLEESDGAGEQDND